MTLIKTPTDNRFTLKMLMLVADGDGLLESIYNRMLSRFPWIEPLIEDTEITSVFEFLADQCYHVGYSHGESDSGAYIAELEAITAVKSHLGPCPECGGMGFTIGFIGQKRQKFPCSTCGDKQ